MSIFRGRCVTNPARWSPGLGAVPGKETTECCVRPRRLRSSLLSCGFFEETQTQRGDPGEFERAAEGGRVSLLLWLNG